MEIERFLSLSAGRMRERENVRLRLKLPLELEIIGAWETTVSEKKCFNSTMYNI